MVKIFCKLDNFDFHLFIPLMKEFLIVVYPKIYNTCYTLLVHSYLDIAILVNHEEVCIVLMCIAALLWCQQLRGLGKH